MTLRPLFEVGYAEPVAYLGYGGTIDRGQIVAILAARRRAIDDGARLARCTLLLPERYYGLVGETLFGFAIDVSADLADDEVAIAEDVG